MNITLINDLIDQHGDSYITCKGCSICNQIQSLRGAERTPEQKYKRILDKGQDMTFSDITFLLECKVERKKIAKSLGMSQSTFFIFLKETGIAGSVEKVCMEAEEYQKLKKEGLKDKEVAERIGVPVYKLRNWKHKNGIKSEVKAIRDEKKTKTAEYESLIAELKEQLSHKEQRIEMQDKLLDKVNKYIEEKEHLNAACDDVESELATVTEERDNQRLVIETTRHVLERYETENQLLRKLLALWA